jgi:hypothetical protein
MFDSRTPERMAMTKVAWERLHDYDVYLSDTVLDELGSAPPLLREKMMGIVEKFHVLSVDATAERLARRYVEQGIFPEKYYDDALHVAIASVHQIGILLSWNFAHLVKMKTRRMVAIVNADENCMPVEIIAPPEL